MNYANITPLPWRIVCDDAGKIEIIAGDRLVAVFQRREDAQFVLDMIEFKEEKANLEKTIVELEAARDKAADERDDLRGDVYLLKEELGQKGAL